MRADSVNRFFSFVTAILLLLLLCFVVSRILPGEKIAMSSPPSQGLKLDLEAQRAMIRKSFHQLGYDLPLFYFSISSYVVQDTFVRMPDPVKRKSLIQIAYASAQPELTYRTLEYVEQRYGLSNPFIGQDAGTQLSIRKDLKMLESDPVIKSALTEYIFTSSSNVYNNLFSRPPFLISFVICLLNSGVICSWIELYV